METSKLTLEHYLGTGSWLPASVDLPWRYGWTPNPPIMFETALWVETFMCGSWLKSVWYNLKGYTTHFTWTWWAFTRCSNSCENAKLISKKFCYHLNLVHYLSLFLKTLCILRHCFCQKKKGFSTYITVISHKLRSRCKLPKTGSLTKQSTVLQIICRALPHLTS